MFGLLLCKYGMLGVEQMREDNNAQMLLATGIVLMLSLLTMAWFGVSVAGLGDPYDPGTEEVIEVAETFSEVWQPLIENRSTIFVNGGHDWEESVNAAANSTANDLMRHGEHRGVEIIITEMNVTNSSGTYTIVCEVGIADRHARLQLISFEAEVDFN